MDSLKDTTKFSGEQDVDVTFKDVENLSVAELVKLAEESFESMNYDRCYIFFEEAMKKNQQDEYALTAYGFFLSNMKETDKAREVLTQAIMLYPSTHPKKYLYMAELYTGEEAATFYLKAVDILTASIQNAISQNVTKEVFDIEDAKKDLSQTYSALGELMMTDLNKAENAQQLCHDYLVKAVEVDGTNLDAYYQLANYYLEVDDPETAEKSVLKLMEIYKSKKESDDNDYFDEFSKETYLGITKLLIELPKYEDALIVIEDMAADNSDDLEIIYLNAYVNFMLRNYLTAQEIMEQFNSTLFKVGLDDKELFSAKSELEKELQKVDVTTGNDYEEANDDDEEDEGNLDLE